MDADVFQELLFLVLLAARHLRHRVLQVAGGALLDLALLGHLVDLVLGPAPHDRHRAALRQRLLDRVRALRQDQHIAIVQHLENRAPLDDILLLDVLDLLARGLDLLAAHLDPGAVRFT